MWSLNIKIRKRAVSSASSAWWWWRWRTSCGRWRSPSCSTWPASPTPPTMSTNTDTSIRQAITKYDMSFPKLVFQIETSYHTYMICIVIYNIERYISWYCSFNSYRQKSPKDPKKGSKKGLIEVWTQMTLFCRGKYEELYELWDA